MAVACHHAIVFWTRTSNRRGAKDTLAVISVDPVPSGPGWARGYRLQLGSLGTVYASRDDVIAKIMRHTNDYTLGPGLKEAMDALAQQEPLVIGK